MVLKGVRAMKADMNQNGAKLEITLEGELDTRSAPELDSKFQDIKASVSEIDIYMDRLTYITSAGLRILLAMEQEMEEKNGSLTLHGVNDDIMEIFEITGFDTILEIV